MQNYDHDAEVLYLKELCALETISLNLNQRSNKHRSYMHDLKINIDNSARTINDLEAKGNQLRNTNVHKKESLGLGGVISLITGNFFTYFLGSILMGIVGGAISGVLFGLIVSFCECDWVALRFIDKDTFIICSLIGAGLGLISGIVGMVTDTKQVLDVHSDQTRTQLYEEALQQHNSEIKATSDELATQSSFLEQSKKQFYATSDKLQLCNAELGKCEELLNSYYAVNIIPQQYRHNIQAIYYFYSYVSTSRFSLEQAIENYMHQEIINRLDTIIKQMNVMIEQQGEIIINQRRQEAQMKDLQKRNEIMLHKLSSIEQDAAISAQYSQMASTYAEAGMYFSAATYLQALNR